MQTCAHTHTRCTHTKSFAYIEPWQVQARFQDHLQCDLPGQVPSASPLSLGQFGTFGREQAWIWLVAPNTYFVIVLLRSSVLASSIQNEISPSPLRSNIYFVILILCCKQYCYYLSLRNIRNHAVLNSNCSREMVAMIAM